MQTKVKKWLLRFLFLTIMLFCLAALYFWLHYSPAGMTYPASEVADIELLYPMRTSAEHDSARSRNGGNPYILEIETEANGALMYYGASHSSDPNHPEKADIISRWESFKPTVAFYEGRSSGFVYGPIFESLAGLPEPALVHKLAKANDVPLYTLEPSYKDEVHELLEKYSAEQLALYFFLRVYTSESNGLANEGLAIDLLHKRTNVDGLKGSLRDLEDVDRIWEQDFPEQEGWRTLSGEPGYLYQISLESRRVRGRHMTRILIDMVQKGERVFAVVGSGHVIRQEWNLRETFGMNPAWDQPKLK
jgi:hypothetical protein